MQLLKEGEGKPTSWVKFNLLLGVCRHHIGNIRYSYLTNVPMYNSVHLNSKTARLSLWVVGGNSRIYVVISFYIKMPQDPLLRRPCFPHEWASHSYWKSFDLKMSLYCTQLYCAWQILSFLQIKGVWQCCVRQDCWCHFSSSIYSYSVSASHLSYSLNISKFSFFFLFVTVICDQWLQLAESSGDRKL